MESEREREGARKGERGLEMEREEEGEKQLPLERRAVKWKRDGEIATSRKTQG